MKPSIKFLKSSDTLLVECQTVANKLISTILCDLPSAYDKINCTVDTCSNRSLTPAVCFNYVSQDGRLDNLSTFITQRMETQTTMCYKKSANGELCYGPKSKTSVLTWSHLVIDVLHWPGIDTTIHLYKQIIAASRCPGEILLIYFIFYFQFTGEDNNDSSTEVASHINIALNDIPKTLNYLTRTFKLRGVGCFLGGGIFRRSRSSIGHYYACCLRESGIWQVFDDMDKKVKSVDGKKKVQCEFLIYTI